MHRRHVRGNRLRFDRITARSALFLKDSVQNSRKRGQSKEGSQRWMNP
ncbi:hypothetical protein A3768_0948 [Ralstonia solanacearum]|nr:hypothetical protein A3768_0948 [Ralstonia solanacearum]